MKSRTPKVLHKLGGRPLLARVLDTAAQIGASETVCVLRFEAERISKELGLVSQASPTSAELSHSSGNLGLAQLAHNSGSSELETSSLAQSGAPGNLELASLAQNPAPVRVALQSDVPGTGSGALAGVQALSENVTTVLVLSGDVPLIKAETLRTLLQTHQAQSNSATILTAHNAAPYGYGRILRSAEDASRIAGIVEERDASEAQKLIEEVNSGVYVFEAEFLKQALGDLAGAGARDNAQGELYLTDTIALAVEQSKPVGAYEIEDLVQVEGVNDLVQLARLAKIHNQAVCEQHMRAGVGIIDPDSTWIEDGVQIESDVIIEPNCYISGTTKIAHGAKVLLGSRIIDAQIGAGASVGPYAYLRPGADLQPDSKAGTFVEVKNSQLGERSKVPHLSYVGDAQIGEDSNIGAGSIFANYDGVKKHKTQVGSRVKLGSKTVLVAPVKVSDDVYSGAATLLRKDVPSGALVYSKNEQVEVPGWVAKNR